MKVKFFNSTRTDRQLAILLFALILGLYVRTGAPGLLGGDSGEFQTAAWTLGLAHATGYPLYLTLGWIWQHLLALFGVTPAHALNLLSALFGALTVAALYLALMDWLQSTVAVRRMTAILGALMVAVNPTFWSQSLVAEVYTLHALFVVLSLQVAYRLMTVDDSDGHAAAEGKWPLVASLALLIGLSFTHHAMTLLLLPSILIALWWSRQTWLTGVGRIVQLVLFAGLPLVLYLYIPLRSGPGPSPWYHQSLGTETLTLYANTTTGFWQFLSGQSISVGFHDWSGALAQLPQSWLLWRLQFFLPGLVMAGLGLYVLWRARNWPVLLLTVPFFLIQQGFNLFYGIGDILVYYIPLYIVAAIWLAFSADTVAGGFAQMELAAEESQGDEERRPALAISVVLVFVLLWMPLQIGRSYFAQLDQSTTDSARQRWDAILAAAPPTDAIFVSNDRNEIVPLFYYQAVENKLQGITGLFPQIAPEARFADIGATLATALNTAARPVYLIKPMPGLESRFTLAPATEPLVLVQEQEAITPEHAINVPYGPLHFLGYDWAEAADGLAITLYWQVNEPLARDYTTTVQLFDAAGDKIAQDDAPPGGNYYPTSLWKSGERLHETHQLDGATVDEGTLLLVGMYDGATLEQLATPIEIPLTDQP